VRYRKDAGAKQDGVLKYCTSIAANAIRLAAAVAD